MIKSKHSKKTPQRPADNQSATETEQPLDALPGSEQPPEPETMPEQPAADAAAENEALDLKNQLLRLQADFENHRKRMARERQETTQQALASFMIELLPVLDNLNRGREVALRQSSDKAILDGFDMIITQLTGVLERFSLTPVGETLGNPFDHNTSEALNYIPSEEYPEGIVLAETRRGYLLHGRLLRAAQVIVSSGPPAEHAAAAQPASENAAED